MNGISNKISAAQEVRDNEAAKENFAARIIEHGKVPGTRSLGREFKTFEKVAENA